MLSLGDILRHKGLTDEEAYACASSLGRNKHANLIDLSYNKLGSVGAKAVVNRRHEKTGRTADVRRDMW